MIELISLVLIILSALYLLYEHGLGSTMDGFGSTTTNVAPHAHIHPHVNIQQMSKNPDPRLPSMVNPKVIYTGDQTNPRDIKPADYKDLFHGAELDNEFTDTNRLFKYNVQV